MVEEETEDNMWSHVEEDLKKILYNTGGSGYYVGGTLMLKLGKNGQGKTREIGLNINGRGFVLSVPTPTHLKNDRVYLPSYITELTRKIYLKEKGYTPYFSKTITGNCGNIA